MSDLQKILDKWKAEAEAATKGEWSSEGNQISSLPYIVYADIEGEGCLHVVDVETKEDADFIAHSRTTVPLLCKALKKAGNSLVLCRNYFQAKSQYTHIENIDADLASITAILKEGERQ